MSVYNPKLIIHPRIGLIVVGLIWESKENPVCERLCRLGSCWLAAVFPSWRMNGAWPECHHFLHLWFLASVLLLLASEILSMFFLLKKYFFIWLSRVLVAAYRLLVAACGIQFPDKASNLGPLHWQHEASAPGPPGKSPSLFLFSTISSLTLFVACCLSFFLKNQLKVPSVKTF